MVVATGRGKVSFASETKTVDGSSTHTISATDAVAQIATATSRELEFGPAGGTERCALRLAAPVGAVARPSGVVLEVMPLAHDDEKSTAGRTSSGIDIIYDRDVDIVSLRVVGLALPGGSAHHRFSEGGVTVATPTDDDEDEPPFESVRAVLAAGPPDGPIGPPAVGFDGIGPPGELYGPQLPSGTVVGSNGSFTLRPPAPLRAGRLRLTFCTGSEAVDLSPQTFTVDHVVTTRAALPEGLSISLGGVTILDVPPPLATPTVVSLDPVLSGGLDDAISSRSGDGPAELELTVSCKGPCKLRLTVRSPDIETPRRPLNGPAALATPTGPDRVEIPGPGPAARRVESRMTGAFGTIRRTSSSPDGFYAGPAGVTTGTTVSEAHWAATRIGIGQIESKPLRRVGLLVAGSSAELVVELRADSDGPGHVLAAAAVTPVALAAMPRWITVPVGSIQPDDVPGDGLWVVARTNRGRVLWVDGGGGKTRTSTDEGMIWSSAPTGPAIQLFVDDPGGHAPILARVGGVIATMLVPSTPTFDVTRSWPTALVDELAGTAPVEVQVDSGRDLRLELNDLELVDAAPLVLETP